MKSENTTCVKSHTSLAPQPRSIVLQTATMVRTKEVPTKKAAWSLFGGKKVVSEIVSEVPDVDVPEQQVATEKVDMLKKTKKSKEIKKRRWKSGTVVLRDIKKAQNKGNSGFAASPMDRVIREITGEMGFDTSRFAPKALNAIREAAEHFQTDLLRLSNVFTVHRGRVTVEMRDLQLASSLMLAPHMVYEENGSMRVSQGLLRAMRRDKLSIKNDAKLISSRQNPNYKMTSKGETLRKFTKEVQGAHIAIPDPPSAEMEETEMEINTTDDVDYEEAEGDENKSS